ncbi:zinc finger, CCHC-type containing protein [Tanacetum coccineum]
MGDENHIRTLGDYSKPSHEGYRNTIELPVGNNVDFLKLVESFYLDGENRERTRLLLFQFSLRDKASNWLKRLPAGSISTWEDLTTQFLAQFFPPGRTAKLRNDIMMFQQHHGESLSEAWTHFKELLQKIDRAAAGKLRNKNIDKSWEIFENLALYDYEGPSPQPQALKTTFEARVRDYMAARTERMERFENTIFKQREEINGRMTKMTPDNTEKLTKMKTEMQIKEVEKINEIENGAGNKSIKTYENEEAVEAPAGKKKGKEYKILPRGPAYDAILKKKITRKEDIGWNFEIPCSVGDLKPVNALVDQGSDVNVMPYSTYMRLTDERHAETDIRLSLASHSYIYPLGIAKDVLVEVAEHIFPVDFVILDINENEKRPFVLGTPFLKIAKAND